MAKHEITVKSSEQQIIDKSQTKNQLVDMEPKIVECKTYGIQVSKKEERYLSRIAREKISMNHRTKEIACDNTKSLKNVWIMC